MVYVKLLKDVAEGGRDLAEAVKAAESFGLGKGNPSYPQLKTTTTNGKVVGYRKDVIVTMHEESAKKWLASGLCEVVDRPAA